jgi:hypothetical protein
MRNSRLHQLPRPSDVLAKSSTTVVELRVTLSYFIEPPSARQGWKRRYSYASHGLRFETRRQVNQRPNSYGASIARPLKRKRRPHDIPANRYHRLLVPSSAIKVPCTRSSGPVTLHNSLLPAVYSQCTRSVGSGRTIATRIVPSFRFATHLWTHDGLVRGDRSLYPDCHFTCDPTDSVAIEI